MSHQPTHNIHPGQHHPYPICQVAIRRLNVTKPTVSTTNHLPATSGATNPADTHHITTHTSEDPPNDETGGKAPALSSFQFRLGGEGMPPRSVVPSEEGGYLPVLSLFQFQCGEEGMPLPVVLLIHDFPILARLHGSVD